MEHFLEFNAGEEKEVHDAKDRVQIALVKAGKMAKQKPEEIDDTLPPHLMRQ